jgi:hypothetical protein
LEAKTLFNVLIACFSSTSDQAENASFASSIEHVHHFTVILPHRMQGMTCPPAREIGAHGGARMHIYLPTSLASRSSPKAGERGLESPRAAQCVQFLRNESARALFMRSTPRQRVTTAAGHGTTPSGADETPPSRAKKKCLAENSAVLE